MNSASSNPALTMRPMTGSDIDRAMEIAAQSAFAPHWYREAYADAVAHNATTPRHAYVAELEGEVTGFVIANLIADEAEMESLAVATNCQRRGIATSLLRHLLANLRSAGVNRLLLEVRESNTIAQRLYTRRGFLHTGRRRGYYHSPDEDALIFELRLS